MTIKQTEQLRARIESSLTLLIKKIGPIQIGRKDQFPYGWRKAAKGRTVWRIVEEVVTQNLEMHHGEFKLDAAHASDSEVSVYDMECVADGMSAFINVKSAVETAKVSKDDISKAIGLLEFYQEDINRQFFVATFFIKFNPDMSIQIDKVVVFPVAWIPDIYVNPSNNGNLQSAHYKQIAGAIKRTNEQFLQELLAAKNLADTKKKEKE